MMRLAMIGTHQLRHGPRASSRQSQAAEWLEAYGLEEPVLVLAPSSEAGMRVVRRASTGRAAVFGWQRITPGELAARLAAGPLADADFAAASHVVLDAVVARLVHRLREEGDLGRFAAVGDRPGLPRALARSFIELSMARIDPAALTRVDPDVGRLYAAYRTELDRASLADPSDILRFAVARATDVRSHPLLDTPIILFDVPQPTALDASLIVALAARATIRAILPSGDKTALHRLSNALGIASEPLTPGTAPSAATTALDRLTGQLFLEIVERGPLDASVELFSAPGESRECVEIARRVLRAAEEGIRFDRMAVFTHSPERYRAPLVEAFRRAEIPAYFSRGTVRPDATGRALLALLSCAAEDLSARAFAEYLSFGVVPDAGEAGEPPSPGDAPWRAPELDSLRTDVERAAIDAADTLTFDPDAPVFAGTLRAPWRWERLIVDAAVIGGAERWRERLDGLERGLETRLAPMVPDDERRARLEKEKVEIAHLRAFALPLLTELGALPRQATWGEWSEHLARLAERAIRDPNRVLQALAELAPMGPIGPVGLIEVQLVLRRRLTDLVSRPTGAPASKVYVASTSEARGLTFDRVFVPGLAERVFPRKVVEDPITLDRRRRELSPELATAETRVEQERLALRLAIGAAEHAVVLSYPRLDTDRGRPRVPSFYGLEVVRAVEGSLPTLSELSRRAETAGNARMAWPAPELAEDAIDGAEYDLAVLRGLLRETDAAVGAANYLVQANPHLARSLRTRFARWNNKWCRADGMVNPSETTLGLLAGHKLSARPYSATALQHYAACPYRFFLSAIVRLTPHSVPDAIEELDALSRGTLIHQAQSQLFGRLREADLLPVTEERYAEAKRLLDEVLIEVDERFRAELAPAIDRVWRDAMRGVASDLTYWLHRMAERPDWVPVAAELAFGLPDLEGRDPASVPTPVEVAGSITLRGSIDLVEERDHTLRATDHKTGRATEVGVIGGGKILQPALYALALEALRKDRRVAGGRLYFCTTRGRFTERNVALTDQLRDSVKVLADVVGEAITTGFLPAAPDKGECARCNYVTVCGPSEERRIERKRVAMLGSLRRLRQQP